MAAVKNVHEYRDALHDPYTWITRCIGLFQSAEAVWLAGERSSYNAGSNNPRPESPLDMLQCFGFYKVSMMLYGMAVEVALKGILIRQRSDKVIVQLETDGGGTVRNIALKNVGDSGGGHNLVLLAQNAGLISKDDSKDVEAKRQLRCLAEYVVWRGRYPVPKAMGADDERETIGGSTETQKFVRDFLREHLTWPD